MRVAYKYRQLPVHLDNNDFYSPLINFFKLNETNALAKTLRYEEMPLHFYWDSEVHFWIPRRR